MPEYDDETAGATDEQSAVATAESDESVEAASTDEAAPAEVPDAWRRLHTDEGAEFDHDTAGELSLTREGGHHRNRIAHAQHWTHDDGPRPTLCVIHGFGILPVVIRRGRGSHEVHPRRRHRPQAAGRLNARKGPPPVTAIGLDHHISPHRTRIGVILGGTGLPARAGFQGGAPAR